MNIVLDASVAMHWGIPHGSASDGNYAREVLDSSATDAVIVPAIWSLEIANALARMEKKGLIDEARIGAAIAFLNSLAIEPESVNTGRDLSDTLHLARRFGISAYDAAYLELAIRTGFPLATLDGSLRTAAGQAGVEMVAQPPRTR